MGSVFESAVTGETQGQQRTRYSPSTTLGPTEVDAMLLHDWRARREIVQLMGDSVRKGVELELPAWVDEAAVMSELEGKVVDGRRESGLLGQLGELLGTGNAYAGAVLIAVTDDEVPAWEPLDPNNLRAVTAWEVVDRWSIWPHRKGGAGTPVDFWLLTGLGMAVERSSQIVHPSRVLVHAGMWMPRRWRELRDGWGASVLELLRDQRDTLATGHAQLGRLLMRSSQDVVVLAELTELLEEKGEAAVAQRLAVMNTGMTSTGLLVLDGGMDKTALGQEQARRADAFATMGRPLGGAKDIAELQHDDWRRGSAMPAVVADGEVASGGLNSGEAAGAWRAWGGTVSAVQQSTVTPWLNWGLGLIFASKDGPTGGRVPEEWTAKWVPIADDDAEVVAKTDKLRAEVDEIQERMGVLRAAPIRKWRAVDGKGGQVRVEESDLLPEPTEGDIAAALAGEGGATGRGR